MTAYYNEINPYAAEWLRNLIKAKAIADGIVDTRSITEVTISDLKDFKQCHFFAGIGGWSHALRLAGVSDDTPVWTGSCPCQPFSNAGRKNGTSDDRHLWPIFYNLIKLGKPPVVFGEQVTSKLGYEWLDTVSVELEAENYAFGAASLSAGGVGAPHIRQRLFFVGKRLADSAGNGRKESLQQVQGELPERSRSNSFSSWMADARNDRLQRGVRRGQNQERETQYGSSGRNSTDLATGKTNSFWRNVDWILCKDGKWRPVEPGTFPLANGISSRVGRLCAYGNAIVPQVAAEFIKAAL